MELDESQLRSVRDVGVLHTLTNGIQIQRRKKHEPIRLKDLSRAELKRRTDKINGSKFLPGTSLKRIVEMTCEILLENDAQPGSSSRYNKVYEAPIGISRGRQVFGLTVVTSNKGKYAHGFPCDEKRP